VIALNNPFTFDKFLWIFENDDKFLIDETVFYFDDDPEETEHYLGCLRQYDKPYWAGYCDIKDGYECLTAYELLTAPIYNGKSIKDRWENVVLVSMCGLSIDEWKEQYQL